MVHEVLKRCLRYARCSERVNYNVFSEIYEFCEYFRTLHIYAVFAIGFLNYRLRSRCMCKFKKMKVLCWMFKEF